MKKFVSILGILFGFFIFSFNLSAATYKEIDVVVSDGTNIGTPALVDGVEEFNILKEKRENTKFYQLLSSLNLEISNYLESLSSSFSFSSRNYAMFIFTREELDYYNKTDISEGKLHIPEGTTHAIYVYSVPTSYMPGSILQKDNYFYFSIGSYTDNHGIYYFKDDEFLSLEFDKTGGYGVSDTNIDYFNSWFSRSYQYVFPAASFQVNQASDFGYLLSKLYYSFHTNGYNYYSSSIDEYTKVNLRYFCYNGDCTSDSKKIASYGFDKFNKYPILSRTYNFYPYLNLINDTAIKYNIPTKYSNVTFSLSSNLILFPKTTCEVKDYSLYLTSTSDKDITLYLHTIGTDDKLGYQASYYSNYSLIKNSVSYINPLYKVSDVTNNSVISFTDSDFVKYYYRFQVNDNKSTNYVYFNPDCYTYTKSSSTSSSFDFVNPQTGNTVTFNTGVDTEWADPENVGSGNSTNFFDLDVGGLISNIKDGGSTIFSGAVAIVSLCNDLFNSLPSSIQVFLITVCLISLTTFLIRFIKSIIS